MTARCASAASALTSEHKEGRAWDWAIPATTKDRATAQHVVDWLSADNGVMARRFGIMYIIWDRHIWGVYRPQDGWRPYSGESAHTDHVHFSFSWDGAEKRTSWWTGVPVTVAGPGPVPAVRRSARADLHRPQHQGLHHTAGGPALGVRARLAGAVQQQREGRPGALGVRVTGTFDATTRTTLIAWQKAQQLPVTGVLDNATWDKLVPAHAARTAEAGHRPRRARDLRRRAPRAPQWSRPWSSWRTPRASRRT